MIKAYLGGSYGGRKRIAEIAERLRNLGIAVNCKWFDDSFFIEKQWDNNFGGDVAEVMARIDESAIRDADVVFIDTIDKSSTGGSDTELGLARGYDKHIIHIGPYRNIFQKLANEHYESWDVYFNRIALGVK